MHKPRIFISHCEGNLEPTKYAIAIINYIGCVPVVAESFPKLAKTVMSVVKGAMSTCDAVVVIATPDLIDKKGKGNSPSRGVLSELGILGNSKKFKGKYCVIKERSVSLGAMNTEARYTFSGKNYSSVAEGILIELGSMGLFKNVYELPGGNDSKTHEFLETIYQLKSLFVKGKVDKRMMSEIAGKMKNEILKSLTSGKK